MRPRSSLDAVERRRCRSQSTICNPTDNENAASFVDASIALMQSSCLHLCQSSKPWCMCERMGGEKDHIEEGRCLNERRSHVWSPRPGAFLCRVHSLWGSPASSHRPRTFVWLGQIDLRCEYLCESLLLDVSPAVSWWLQGLPCLSLAVEDGRVVFSSTL